MTALKVVRRPSVLKACKTFLTCSGLALALPRYPSLPSLTVPPSVPALIREALFLTRKQPLRNWGIATSSTLTIPVLKFWTTCLNDPNLLINFQGLLFCGLVAVTNIPAPRFVGLARAPNPEIKYNIGKTNEYIK